MSGITCANHIFIYRDGKLEGTGENNANQLGIKQKEPVNIPRLIMEDNQIEMICCGQDHTILLKSNHHVLVCGSNQFGQLGLGGSVNKIPKFTLLSKYVPISKIQCGNFFTILLKRNSNEFISFGQNNNGQLGIGTDTYFEKETHTVKIKDIILDIVSGNESSFIRTENQVFGFGSNFCCVFGASANKFGALLEPTLLLNEKIKKVICGGAHTIYWKENGDLFGHGWNSHGQLGIVNKIKDNDPFCSTTFEKSTFILNDPEIKDVSCGTFHTLVLKNNGELFGFGINDFGASGLGEKRDTFEPTLIIKDENIEQICSFDHSNMFLKNNGELFVFGRNDKGQIGMGFSKCIRTPELLMKDEKIECLIMGNKRTPIEWKKENHKQFPILFKIQIETFLLSLRIFSTIILKQKVPKPIQEIIIGLISKNDIEIETTNEDPKKENPKYENSKKKCNLF